ncbi:uncharacterized protein LOC129568320 [Sitodiplosis mosellana]|uniref:uncharacterized protein LOC129568320 n=1 Tax=Sitodiplosis mosellana TaxID=263140 RepID=UPI002443FA44|nr:uncharacterized protein LOC129568320 [Sitodiplosis mosellana]
MVKLLSVLILSTIALVASSAFISDFVQEFNFSKIDNKSYEYNFEYEFANGRHFRGVTYLVFDGYERFYMMLGANKSIYWVFVLPEEFENVTTFSKPVRNAKRSGDEITMQDDFRLYVLNITMGVLYNMGYRTEWNMETICFTKINRTDNFFNFIIDATNNSRKYNGTTYIKADDPQVQHIRISDWPQRRGEYEVGFSNQELDSQSTFCKGISRTVSEEGISNAFPRKIENAKLLEALEIGSNEINR